MLRIPEHEGLSGVMPAFVRRVMMGAKLVTFFPSSAAQSIPHPSGDDSVVPRIHRRTAGGDGRSADHRTADRGCLRHRDLDADPGESRNLRHQNPENPDVGLKSAACVGTIADTARMSVRIPARRARIVMKTRWGRPLACGGLSGRLRRGRPGGLGARRRPRACPTVFSRVRAPHCRPSFSYW